MSNQFDDDFAPLRIAPQDAKSNNIVKDARIDSGQIMKVRKIPLFIGNNHSGDTSTSFNKSTYGSPGNNLPKRDVMAITVNDVEHDITSEIPTMRLTPCEQIIIQKVLRELQDMIFSPHCSLNTSQEWPSFIPSPHFSLAYNQLEDKLSEYIKYDNSSTSHVKRLVNLMDTDSKYIHAGLLGLHLVINKLRITNPEVSFIIINSQDGIDNVENYVFTELVSQLYRIDPTALNRIKNVDIDDGIGELMFELVEFSNATEALEKKIENPIKSFLLFVDTSDSLETYYNYQLPDMLSGTVPGYQSCYIKLSNTYKENFTNINCQKYDIEETDHFDEVIEYLKINTTSNSNIFVDVYNDMLTDKDDSSHYLLRRYISHLIRLCYQSNISSLVCSQQILTDFMSQVKKI